MLKARLQKVGVSDTTRPVLNNFHDCLYRILNIVKNSMINLLQSARSVLINFHDCFKKNLNVAKSCKINLQQSTKSVLNRFQDCIVLFSSPSNITEIKEAVRDVENSKKK
jgi:hypothetical protein